MPFYDPYFGYNYQFGPNQGGEKKQKDLYKLRVLMNYKSLL